MAISDVLTDLAACLCAELTPEGEEGPGLCFCGVLPGNQAALEYTWECDDLCGMAWVRLALSYPANGIGIVDERPSNCGAELGVDIEVGIIRCLELPEDGEAPDGATMLASSIEQADDIEAIRRAIACCSPLAETGYILGPYQPYGPQGGIVGGWWTVYATA